MCVCLNKLFQIGQFFGEVDPVLMIHLVNTSLYSFNKTYDYQSVCDPEKDSKAAAGPRSIFVVRKFTHPQLACAVVSDIIIVYTQIPSIDSDQSSIFSPAYYRRLTEYRLVGLECCLVSVQVVCWCFSVCFFVYLCFHLRVGVHLYFRVGAFSRAELLVV